MLINLIKILIILVIIALFVIGLIVFIRKAKNETRRVTIKRLKEIKWVKFSAVLVAVIITICYIVVTYIGTTMSASAKVTLNYTEASLGENANGTRFNMSEIVSNEVMERAIKKGGLEDVKASDLRKCFTVTPLYQGNAFSKENYHVSTEFVLSYESSAATRHIDSKTMVYLICNAYRDYYFEKYVTDFVIPSNNFEEEIADIDYFDIVNYLQTESNRILNYLYGLQKKNSSFVSSNGTTFASVSSKVYNLSNTQIGGNLYSFVLQNGLSKDSAKFADRLTYANEQLSFDKDKEEASYKITNDAVKNYDKQMATIVLVPTWDKDGQYYMGRTKIGIDELSVQAVSFSDAFAKVQKEIKGNELKLTNIKNADGNTAENKKNADKVIETIQGNILKLAEEARQIGKEYYENQMNQCISATEYNPSILSNAVEFIAIFLCAIVATAVFFAAKNYSYELKEDEE